jgi:hypothetical protein
VLSVARGDIIAVPAGHRSYTFARDEEMVSSSGEPVKLTLTSSVVADHAEA